MNNTRSDKKYKVEFSLESVISVFDNIFDSAPMRQCQVKDILNDIKSGTHRKKIDNCRSLKHDETAYREAKKRLPGVTFSANFQKIRAKNQPFQHSNILIADIDHVKNELSNLRQKIESDKHILFNFVSPSNEGFKAGLIFNGKIPDDNTHKRCFAVISKHFKKNFDIEIDPSGKDISRLCFLSWDPDLYINYKAKPFSVPLPPIQKKKKISSHKQRSTYPLEGKLKIGAQALETAINIIGSSSKGNRHYSRLRAGFLVGGHIPDGMIDETTAYSQLESAVSRNTDLAIETAMKTVIDAIQAGKDEPFYYDDIKKKQKEYMARFDMSDAEVESAVCSFVQTKPFFQNSDIGRAERFSFEHGLNLKFSHTQKQWFIWNEKQWAIDSKGHVKKTGIQTAKNIANEIREQAEKAENKEDTKAAKALKGLANKIESRATIENFINLASSIDSIPVVADDLDRDKYLFNCQNGIINLKTGKLLPHDRKYLQTKISPVEYNRANKSELWESFLETILPDPEKRAFLKRYMGYSLSGDTSEECFVIGYGSGANGKSKFIEAVAYAIGDYARTTDSKTFSEARADKIREDLATLKSARFVSASESRRNAILDENLVKSLTGNDLIQCRFLHQNSFEYLPEFKIFLVCNYMPKILSQDHGTWRRINVLNFNITIPKEKQDKHLSSKLKKEAPAILNWLVEGFMEWQEQGLNPPENVKAATKEYQDTSDHLKDFFDDRCMIFEKLKANRNDFYDAYQKYMSDAGQKAFGKNNFNKLMRERGFQDRKSNGAFYWHGIGILVNPQDDTFQNCPNFNETALKNAETAPRTALKSDNVKNHHPETIQDNVLSGQLGQLQNDVLHTRKKTKEHTYKYIDESESRLKTALTTLKNNKVKSKQDVTFSTIKKTGQFQGNYAHKQGSFEEKQGSSEKRTLNTCKSGCGYYQEGFETCKLAREQNKKECFCIENVSSCGGPFK